MLALASSLILCYATVTVANLLFHGPYAMDLESLEDCDDPEYKDLLECDVHLVQLNNGDIVYQGNITFNFDMDDPKLLTKCLFYTWGTTGGWYYSYSHDVYDVMEFSSKKFPKTFHNAFSAMGVNGKPMKAGTYPFRNFSMKDHRLENFIILPYGRFRLVIHFSKDDKPLGCLDIRIRIREKENVGSLVSSILG
ncbi:uncharacterized protein LOC124596385 [Schistocerca americana]|uniref:uncharacterized protein LOC124596385 n=1 Tax=Schistocerca americana TaxID=7009 RepID=UPI001F4F2CED|nr:uncharacterized protein LOC124596385 [Schistocerca americana]XP_049947293.1 uncharacterized protein LOC126455581 isoform X1 [Schistocerca serialis cubense]